MEQKLILLIYILRNIRNKDFCILILRNGGTNTYTCINPYLRAKAYGFLTIHTYEIYRPVSPRLDLRRGTNKPKDLSRENGFYGIQRPCQTHFIDTAWDDFRCLFFSNQINMNNLHWTCHLDCESLCLKFYMIKGNYYLLQKHSRFLFSLQILWIVIYNKWSLILCHCTSQAVLTNHELSESSSRKIPKDQ